MSIQRVVLITGASSGVGQSTARLLSQRGFTVLGTSRNSASAEGIPGVEMLSLDVRADDSVQACVEAVHRRCGHLDVLINNAGYELAGALEELSQRKPGLSSRPTSSASSGWSMRFCRQCVSKNGGTSSTSVRSLVSRRSRFWASIPPASLLWKGTQKHTAGSQALQHPRVADRGRLSQNAHDEPPSGGSESSDGL